MTTTATKLNVLKGASRSKDAATAVRELHAAIGQEGAELAVFYCSPEYDLPVLASEMKQHFGATPIIGCTTAGEMTPIGYIEGSLTGFSVASDQFNVATARIDNLSEFEIAKGQPIVESLLNNFRQQGVEPRGSNTFGFLLIDGLSMQEEAVVSALYRNLGDISLFGGSAGDGVEFGKTLIYHDGAFRENAAVFTLVNTSHPFVVFKTESFVESDKKLVITAADPKRRVVTEINGEPAGLEYARMVGLDVDKLTPMIFATYPVVVRIGGSYYVRSIQKVNDDGSITFFCAIDEGLVLTVARGVDLVENLKDAFAKVQGRIGKPELVIGCDCILRHLEIERDGINQAVADILIENNVVGFSTYGEQFNAMHVNQTFTGVAIGK